MKHYVFYPKNVCSSRIDIDIENGIVHNLVYTDGCSGNLQAIGRLAEGLEVKTVIKLLEGIRCGASSTSCGDQLAKCLKSLDAR